ncbi:MAG: Ig-like domain-containing protein, partial [Tumebacillaceae bacterium]
ILSVTATDAAQNSSSAATRSVIDTTAPTAPRANAVKDTDLVVTGTAETYATLTATIGDKQFNGTAGKDGKYSIAIEQQDLNAVLSLTATDASGNKSAATSVKVVAGALALNSAVVADATSSLQLSRKNATSYTSTENTLFSDQAVGTVTFAFNKKISKSSANDIGVYLNSSRTQVPDAIKNLLLSKLQDGASNELTVHLSLTYQQLKNALNLFNERPVTSLRIVVKDFHGNSSTITLTIK